MNPLPLAFLLGFLYTRPSVCTYKPGVYRRTLVHLQVCTTVHKLTELMELV
jgi:hypothetical protein